MWQIIGSGAIACLWAANLLRSGQSVHLVSRTQMTEKRLVYQDLQGNISEYACAHSTRLINASSPILVCVKAPQVKQALQQQLAHIGPQQPLILMHNGMGCAEQVAALLPDNPIICATTANASLLHGPLNIQQTGLGITYLGAFNDAAQAFSGLVDSLNKALDNCHWCADIEHKLWLKLMINIAINPLTAIFQVNNGALAAPHFQQQIDTIVEEAMPALHNIGLPLTQTQLRQLIDQVITATANNFSSMNRDIHFQRATENDYINGYLLNKAAQYKISMPLIQDLYEQVKAREHH